MKLIWTIFIILLLFTLAHSQEVTLRVDGNWTRNIGSADLTGGAGSDLQSTYNSSNDGAAISMDISKSPWWLYLFVRWNWRIDVNYEIMNWHPNMQLWVRRTGQESDIYDGMNFQQVTTNPTYFISGNRNHYNVPLEYELRGISVYIPVDQYQVTVVYTITEL